MHVVFAQYAAENQCMLSLHNMRRRANVVFVQYAEEECNMLASHTINCHIKLTMVPQWTLPRKQ